MTEGEKGDGTAMEHHSRQSEDYLRIEEVILYLEENFKSQPSLDEIAASAHLSKYHLDRLFKRWAGISPMQFMKFLTLDHTKRKLAESRSLLEASLDAGLSGPGRLHDLFVSFEAMTPGEFKARGAGLTIDYGFGDSPFGTCLLAMTGRGICHLGFIEGEERPRALDRLSAIWPRASFNENTRRIEPIVARIFAGNHGEDARPFHLHVRGTNFQVNVWKALLTLPEGGMASYLDIATAIGKPRACRAVAGAIAVNPVAYLIPCHRVISRSGKIHRYQWGSSRKKALIGWEAARTMHREVG